MDEYKNRCYICWESEDLVNCYQCKYGVCRTCLVKDDRFSRVVPRLCRHDECAYFYLSDKEKDTQNCFVCSKHPLKLEFKCGMCIANSQVDLDDYKDAVMKIVLKDGLLSKEADIINQILIYYTIKDLDRDSTSLACLWKIPGLFNNRDQNFLDDRT